MLVNLLRRNIENFRLGVNAVRHDARLRTGQGNSGYAEPMQCQRQKRDGLLLAGGKKHVNFAGSGFRIDLAWRA